MLFAVMAPAAVAVEEKVFESGKTPIIYIRGNGEQIYEADGVTPIVATFEDLGLEGGGKEGEEGLGIGGMQVLRAQQVGGQHGIELCVVHE